MELVSELERWKLAARIGERKNERTNERACEVNVMNRRARESAA